MIDDAKKIVFKAADKQFDGTIEELAEKYGYVGCLDCLNHAFAKFQDVGVKSKPKPQATKTKPVTNKSETPGRFA